MLNDQDMERIGKLMDDKFAASEERITTKIVLDVGEMISDQVFPRLDSIESRLGSLEAKVKTLPDKDYLDRKLAPINGKMNVLVDVLHQNKAITDDQKRIVQLQA